MQGSHLRGHRSSEVGPEQALRNIESAPCHILNDAVESHNLAADSTPGLTDIDNFTNCPAWLNQPVSEHVWKQLDVDVRPVISDARAVIRMKIVRGINQCPDQFGSVDPVYSRHLIVNFMPVEISVPKSRDPAPLVADAPRLGMTHGLPLAGA